MHWVRRIGRQLPPAAEPSDNPVPGPAERVTPGVAALFEGVSEDRSHAVLDLGPAAGSTLRVYSRFARWVRFADILTATNDPERWDAELRSLGPNPERPFDLVLAWDILDRLPPAERPRLVERLAAISARDARLFVLVESTDVRSVDLLSFTLGEIDRVSYESTGEPRGVHPPLLPAQVKGLLSPFHVQRAFTTQSGWREYVAERRGNGAA